MHDDYLLVIGDVDEQLLPYLCFCTTGCSEAEWAATSHASPRVSLNRLGSIGA